MKAKETPRISRMPPTMIIDSHQHVVAGQRPQHPGEQPGEHHPAGGGETVAEDSVIEIPDPREMIIHRGRRMRAKVLDILPLSHNVRQLRLKPDSQFSYSPGQFVEVELGRGINRMYSMAGLAADEELQFHVRLHPYGRASHVIGEDLKPDDTVRVRGPYGVSYLRQFHDAPILCVSAGTGLAPLKSLLRGLIDFRMMNPVHVYVGFMSREEVYDLEALSGLLALTPAPLCTVT